MVSLLRRFFSSRNRLFILSLFVFFLAAAPGVFAATTTLNDGTNPGNATTTPGGSAVMSDAFTLQTDTGTETISSIVVSAANNSPFTGVSLIEITSDNGSIVYGSTTNPTGYYATTTLNMNTLTASTTLTQYKIRITPKTHANMPPPPGDNYLVYARVSSWTGANTHAGSDNFAAAVYIDNLSPSLSLPDGVNWVLRAPTGNRGWISSTYGKGLYVALACGGVNSAGCDYNTASRLMTSPDGITWTDRWSSAEGDQWRSVTYGNGTFVALAWTGTYEVRTSTDGITWTDRFIPNDSWLSVTYGNGLFVAVSYTGQIATSPDGITWTSRTSPAANIWRSVTYGNGLFVAVSENGTNRIMTSPDGINWTLRTGPAGNNWWESVTYGNGLFVAVAEWSDSANYIITSPDGITWTVRTTPSYNYWMSVVYGNGLFVATAISGTGNRVMTSHDGITWILRQSPADNDWFGVGYGNGMFIGTANNGSSNRIMTSGAPAVAVTPGYQDATLSYTVPTDTDINSVIVLRSSSYVTDVPVEGTTYSVGNTIGSATVACIDTAVSPGATDSCTATGLTNGVNYYFKVFAKDSNGNYSVGIEPRGLPVAPGNAAYLGTGTDPVSMTIAPGASATTSDAFTLQSVGGNKSVSSVVVDLGSTDAASALSLVEITNDAGTTVYGSVSNPTNSTTSISLSGFTDSSVVTQYRIRITPKTHANMPSVPGKTYEIKTKVLSFVESGSFYHPGSDTAGATITIDNQSPATTATDVTTWTSRTSAADNSWSSVAYGSSTFVAVAQTGTGNRVMTSPDGTTWTSRTSAADNAWRSVTYANGLFVAVSADGTGNRVMTSPDGITWTSRTSAMDNNWNSITYGNGLFVAVAGNGNVGAGDGAQVMTSPDGITWTARRTPDNGGSMGWSSITYGNGLFVAMASNNGSIMTSADGINWILRNSIDSSNQWTSITYGNGLFVAVANSGANPLVATSPDGITWTARTQGAYNNWSYVTYGNGLFVAVASSGTGNRVMTSPDGITWTARTSAVDNNWGGVAYGNGTFVAVSNTGTGNRVMTSALSVPTVSAADSQITLSYTTPGDSDLNSIVVLRSTSAVTDTPVEGTSYSVGNTIGSATVACIDSTAATSTADSCIATGLTNGTNYYFKIFAKDANGNYSTGVVPAGLPISPGLSITLGNGSDPSATTTAPGSVVMADAFTFQTATGSQAISSVVVNLGAAAAIGSASPTQTYYALTSGSSWTVPAGVTAIQVWSIGAGAGGAGAIASDGTSGGAGGAGGISYGNYTVTPGSSLSYSIGTAGTGGTGGSNGGAGGDTSITIGGTTLLGRGGTGGQYNSGATGPGGTATGGSTNSSGGSGAGATGDTGGGGGGGLNGANGTANGGSGGNGGVANDTQGLFTALSALGYSTSSAGQGGGSGAGSPNAMNGTSATGFGAGGGGGGWYGGNGGNGYFGGGGGGSGGYSATQTGGNGGAGIIIIAATSTGNAYSVAKIEITSDDGAIVYGSSTSITATTTTVTLNTNTLTATSTAAQYKIRLTLKSHASMPTPPGDTYMVSAKIDSWVGGGTLSGSDTAGGTVTVDNLSPVTTANDGIAWTTRTSAADNNWTSVTYGNGLFVAVSNTATTSSVMTSPDGITWTLRSTPTTNTWTSVTYGNGLFVAVANSGTGNRVMTSPDGITWTSRSTTGLDNYWTSVTYGNSLFVAVACGTTSCSIIGGTRVMTSPDGITWTARTAPGSDQWQSVTYGNGLFVAVSNYIFSTNYVMTSPDGITWTGRGGYSAFGNNYMTPTSVTYGNGMFVIMPNGGYNIVATSSNGTTWTTKTLTGSWNSVTYGNGLFVAVGSNAITTSPDGSNWTTQTSPVNNVWTGIDYVNGTFVAVSNSGTGNRVMTSTSSIPAATAGDTQATLSYTTPGDSDLNSIVVLRSTSAVTDTPVEGTSYSVGNTIGSATVACIDSTAATSTADSCIATGLTNGTNYYFKIFAKDANGNYSTGVVPAGLPIIPNPMLTLASGTDPTSSLIAPGGAATMAGAFTVQTSSGSGTVSSAVVNLGSAAATSGVALIEITSDNGATVYGSVANPTNATTSITLNTNVLTANTTPTQYKIRITPKTHANMPAAPGDTYTVAAKIDSLAISGFIPRGSDTSGTTITIDNESPSVAGNDGITWTTRVSSANGSPDAITYGNGTFVAVSSFSGAPVLTSTDGITWTSRTSSGLGWASVTYGNGLFVAVGYSGIGNRVMTSPDGITWTSRTSAADTYWRSVTYGAGKFVAVACGTSICDTNAGTRVMTSSDGITWTAQTAPLDMWTSVTYGNGLFVAVSQNSATSSNIMTSTDGITWTIRTGVIGKALYSVTYGNGLFVAGSGNPLTSPDGITWTSRAANFGFTAVGMTYGNGLFVAVGDGSTNNNGSISTSLDGINWTTRTPPSNVQWYSIAYGNGMFAAVGGSSGFSGVITSSTTQPIATPGDGQVTLSYSTGTSTQSIITLRSTSPIATAPTEGATYVVSNVIGGATVICVDTTTGTSSSCAATSLTNGTPYYFKVFAKDVNGNYSVAGTPAAYPITPNPSITLGTGTDPANGSLAPGGSATMADSFTLQTSASSVPVSSVVINLGSDTAASSLSLVEITSDNGAIVYGSTTNPTTATTSITLSINTLTANTSLTQYKVRITPKTHANMPAAPGDAYIVNAKIDSVTSAFVSTGSDAAGMTITIDNQAPSAVPPDPTSWVTSLSAADNNWKSVTYGKGLFVAVAQSGTGNRIMTSPDGITWTSRTSTADNSWNSVTYGDGLFVAVAGSGINRVMTSPDGITWTARTVPDRDWLSITYGNGLFVAVSDDYWLYNIMTSPDGVTWTLGPNKYGYWGSVTYGGGIFVAISNSGNQVMTSTDGITWTTGTAPSNSYWRSIAYGNGTFVAIGSNGSNRIMTSVNGLNWTLQPNSVADSNYWTSVTFGNGTFVAVACGVVSTVCNTSNGNRIMTSPDGITWTTQTSPVYYQWQSITYGNGTFVAVSNSGTGNRVLISGTLAPTLTPGSGQTTIAFNNPTDSDLSSVTVLRSTSPVSAVPVDGVTYSVGNTIGAATVACVSPEAPSTSDSCTATGLSNGTTYYYKIFTKDASGNYSTGVLPAGSSTVPGIVTILSTGSDPANSTIAPGSVGTMAGAFSLKTSSGSDTVTSVVVNLGAASTPSSIGLIEITSDTGSTVYGSSTNPTNATTSITLNLGSLTVSTSATQYKIRITPKTHANMPAVPGGTYIINAKIDSFASTNTQSGSDSAGTTITIDNQSPSEVLANDGVTWTSRTSAADNTWHSVAYGNGLFVAVAQSGTGNRVMTSPDGITWTLRTSAADHAWSSVTYGNGLFVAVACGVSGTSCNSTTGNRVMTSPDGITWTLRSTPADSVWSSVTYGNGLFVAVACGAPALGCNTTAGTRIMTSPDGITWTARTAPANDQWNSVTYGNGLFVAISNNNATANNVMTSPDGINWTLRSSMSSTFLQAVTYGNGLFVAVPIGYNTIIATSPDGINWTARTPAVATYWESVTYVAGTFVAVSYYGQVMTSPDGITWTARTAPAANQWFSVTYGNGTFVAVASSGTGNRVMTSTSSQLTATPDDSQATIFYTAPSSTDLQSVVVLRSTSPVVDVPVEGTTYSAGNTIGAATVACVDSTIAPSGTGFCNSTGLANGTAYYFKVFTKDTNGNYSAGTVPGSSPVTPVVASTFDESGYRFFASSTTATPGAAMAAQNTPVTLANDGDAFRMRMTLHVGVADIPANSRMFKLQYSPKVGTCDASFTGETYSDITSSTPIAYYDVGALTNNTALGASADLTHNADTIVNETYIESNPFINSQAAILQGQDGKFDFSLYDNGATSNTSYCIRAVKLNGSLLNSYSVIPEIATAAQQVQQVSFRWRKDDGNETNATYTSSENGTVASTFVAGDKIRLRFALSNTGSGMSRASYELDYATSSCTVWTQVPRTVDVTNQHWRMEPSMYVSDNSVTTHSSGITAPNGKSFTSGKFQTFNNVTQPITLGASNYTELEYSVRSTPYVSPSMQYCFRVAAYGDSSVVTYPVTPQITPASRILRYQGGGGGGGLLNTVGAADVSTSTGTTTVTGGGTKDTSTSTETTATSSNPTSTTTPSQGGGGGNVGLLFGGSSLAYGGDFLNGMVLGASAQSMCVDMSNRMSVGSRDTGTQGEVSELQYFLTLQGYFNSKTTGYFGNITRNAVRKFQKDNGLQATGIVDKTTRERMKDVGCVVEQ